MVESQQKSARSTSACRLVAVATSSMRELAAAFRRCAQPPCARIRERRATTSSPRLNTLRALSTANMLNLRNLRVSAVSSRAPASVDNEYVTVDVVGRTRGEIDRRALQI